MLAVPLCYVLYHGMSTWILLLTLISCATDFLDGYLARRFDEVSDLGKIIDPIADKIMVGAGALSLVANGKIPLWFLAIIIGRDILILLGGIFAQRKTGITLVSTMTGKIAVGILALALMLIALGMDNYRNEIIAVASAALFISFVVYVERFLRFLRNNKHKDNIIKA